MVPRQTFEKESVDDKPRQSVFPVEYQITNQNNQAPTKKLSDRDDRASLNSSSHIVKHEYLEKIKNETQDI